MRTGQGYRKAGFGIKNEKWVDRQTVSSKYIVNNFVQSV
jgi:hypothetical protein